MKAALPTTSPHDHRERPRLPTLCEEAREWCVCEHTRCGRWVRGWTGRGRGCPPVGLVGDGSGAGGEDKVQGGGAVGSRQSRERKEHNTWMRGGRRRLRRRGGWAGRRAGGRAGRRTSLSHRWRYFPAFDACRPSPCAAAPPPRLLLARCRLPASRGRRLHVPRRGSSDREFSKAQCGGSLQRGWRAVPPPPLGVTPPHILPPPLPLAIRDWPAPRCATRDEGGAPL